MRRRSSAAAASARAAVVRVAAAAALTLCLLLHAVPAGAVFTAHCSMPCCRGLSGAGGGCAGGSCPVDLPAEAGPPATPAERHAGQHKEHPVGQSEPVEAHAEEAAPSCHAPAPEAGAETESTAVSPARPAARESARAEHQHAHAGRQRAGAAHEHDADDAAPTPSVAAAHIAPRCPPECGAAAGSFMQTRRTRGEGALSQAVRPRPPTAEAVTRPRPAAAELTSALRRRRPPRGPPTRHTPA